MRDVGKCSALRQRRPGSHLQSRRSSSAIHTMTESPQTAGQGWDMSWWVLIGKVDRGLHEWRRQAVADNQRDSHVCRAGGWHAVSRARFAGRRDRTVGLSPRWLSIRFWEGGGNLVVMLHIYSAAYRPAFQNNTRGKFQTERYQNYNCFAMTCKQFIQFVFGRKPWNSTNHVFIQDQNRFFLLPGTIWRCMWPQHVYIQRWGLVSLEKWQI